MRLTAAGLVWGCRSFMLRYRLRGVNGLKMELKFGGTNFDHIEFVQYDLFFYGLVIYLGFRKALGRNQSKFLTDPVDDGGGFPNKKTFDLNMVFRRFPYLYGECFQWEAAIGTIHVRQHCNGLFLVAIVGQL